MSDTKKEAMFAKLARQAMATQEGVEHTTEPVAAAPPPSSAELVLPKHTPSRKKREPVKGKRENPDYCQANAYVPKSLRRAVEKTILDIDGLDYSSLVEDLLRKWLKSRGVSE